MKTNGLIWHWGSQPENFTEKSKKKITEKSKKMSPWDPCLVMTSTGRATHEDKWVKLALGLPARNPNKFTEKSKNFTPKI